MCYLGNPLLPPQTLDAAQQAGKRQFWERQPGETAKAYAAFQKYLNLSERRTLAKVAEMSGCSSQNVERWSRRWCWVPRVQAFDATEEERFREQLSRDRLAMRRRQIALGVACQNVAAYGVKELQAKVASGSALNLGAEEIKSLLAIGSQLEGKAMGAEGNSRYAKINVVIGGRHRYPHEPCGCKCAACASCHGEADGGTMDLIEGGGEPDKAQEVN